MSCCADTEYLNMQCLCSEQPCLQAIWGTTHAWAQLQRARLSLTGCGGAQKADMWSIGIILYAMLYGRYPFNNQDADFATKILRAEYPVPPDIVVCS